MTQDDDHIILVKNKESYIPCNSGFSQKHKVGIIGIIVNFALP